MPDLTGPFETGKLPRIAKGAVTVAIARTVDPARRTEFENWANRFLDEARLAPGSLGGTILAPAEPGDPYHMVFRFDNVLSLRAWERSEARERMRPEGDDYILSEKVTVTAGTEEFFDALGAAEKPRHRMLKFIGDLAWVYPTAVTVSVVLSPWLAKLNILERVLVSSVIVGATSRLATDPVRRRWRRRRMLPQDAVTR